MKLRILIVLSSSLLLGACSSKPASSDDEAPSAHHHHDATPAEFGPDGLPTTVTAIDGVTGYTDPVCMMQVSPDAPSRYTYEGVTYGFCSAGCKGRFSETPADYLAALEE